MSYAVEKENGCPNGPANGFRSSWTELKVGENKYILRLLRMQDSSLVFICYANSEILENMAVALKSTDNGLQALGTTIIGSYIGSESQILAEKLAKRFKRQFYVSLNVQLDRITGSILETKVIEYLANILEASKEL